MPKPKIWYVLKKDMDNHNWLTVFKTLGALKGYHQRKIPKKEILVKEVRDVKD